MKPIILAISGGADSVYLLHLLLKEGQKPILAHFNHKVRKKESDADEAFVHKLAQKHGLIIEVERKDVKAWAKTNKKSLEEAGRILRYEFFEKIRKKHKASEILTAHHLNDNLETVLMNKMRGCKLRGRIGMRATNNHLRRPLLSTPKSEILAFLKKHNLPYCEDITNKDTAYLRNWIRHILIPELLKKNPALLTDFKKTRNTALKTYKKFKKQAQEWLKKNASSNTFSIADFLKLDSESQKFLLQHIYEETYGSTQNLSSKHIQEIIDLILRNTTGKQKKFGPKLIMRTEYGQVMMNPHAANMPEQNTNPPKPKIDPKTLPLAFDRIPGGILKTRTWQPGDRFQPSGMKGTKKLQDYFTDTKIPRHLRHEIPILTTQDNQIVAVGNRVDERFKAPTCKKVAILPKL